MKAKSVVCVECRRIFLTNDHDCCNCYIRYEVIIWVSIWYITSHHGEPISRDLHAAIGY